MPKIHISPRRIKPLLVCNVRTGDDLTARNSPYAAAEIIRRQRDFNNFCGIPG
jgi:hypothetical protein